MCFALPLAAADWINRPLPVFGQEPTRRVSALAFAQGRFVAIVDQRIHHSVNGVDWIPGPWEEPTLRDLRVVGGAFYRLVDNEVLTSNNGIYWNRFMFLPAATAPVHSSTWATDGTTGLVAQTLVVAEGDAVRAKLQVQRTTDRLTWLPAGALPMVTAQSSVSIESLLGANGRYLITYLAGTAGGGSTAMTVVSSDGGATWQPSAFPTAIVPHRLLYGNGWYIAITVGGEIYRSQDGLTFTQVGHDLPAGFDRHVHFAGGWFITRSGGAGSRLLGSVDARLWQDLGTIPYDRIDTLNGVAYGAGRVLATGTATAQGGQLLMPFMMSLDRNAPAVVRQHPRATRIAATRHLQLSVALEQLAGPVTYRWLKDGAVMAGQTASTLSVRNLTASDAGRYRCLVTNAAGTVASDEAVVTIIDPALGGRLSNLAVMSRTVADQAVHVGFVVAGPSAKPVLVRAVGPTLAQFDVGDFLPDPQVRLMQGGIERAANDNWTLTDGRELGAFPLPAGSRDASLPLELAPGVYSALASDVLPRAGRVLIEVYDHGLANGATRLSNLSARARIAAGEALVAGLVIEGTTPLPVLIRGVGPTLAQHGVNAPVANPMLTLYRADGAPIAFNDDWHDDDGRALGAFPLPAGSADAVLSVTLEPGSYTVHVTAPGALAGAGDVLVEIYDAL